MNETQSITLMVAGQELRMRVAPGQRERFERITRQINQKVDEIRGRGVVGGPRLLAMVLFEMGLDLDESQTDLRQSRESRERLGELIRRIDKATGAGQTPDER